MKISVLSLISLLLILFLSCNRSKKNNPDDTFKDTIDYPSYEDYSNEDLTPVENLLDSNKVNEEDPILTEDEDGNLQPVTEEEINQGNPDNHIFYVIVGSYTVAENAAKAKQLYITKGYAPQVLPQKGPYNRVAIASMNDEKSARAELKRVRSTFNDGSFWLLYDKY